MSASFLSLPSSRPEQVARSSFIASCAILALLVLAGPSDFGVGNVVGLTAGFVVGFVILFVAQLAGSRGARNAVLRDERDASIDARSQKIGFTALLLPLVLWIVEAGRASLGAASPLLFDFTNPSHCLFVAVGGLILAELARSFAAIWLYNRA